MAPRSGLVVADFPNAGIGPNGFHDIVYGPVIDVGIVCISLGRARYPAGVGVLFSYAHIILIRFNSGNIGYSERSGGGSAVYAAVVDLGPSRTPGGVYKPLVIQSTT